VRASLAVGVTCALAFLVKMIVSLFFLEIYPFFFLEMVIAYFSNQETDHVYGMLAHLSLTV
jgi:hypothetical protein